MSVAYIDESGNGGPLFVAGALSAKADPMWLEFSDAWQRNVLDAAPNIPYFKFNNEHQLSAESHGKKIAAGIEIINKYVERADSVIIETAEYEIYFKKLIGVTFDNPIHMGYHHIIQQCALHATEQIDFVFDSMDDTQYLELLSAFRGFKKECPSRAIADRLVQEPIRADDKKVLPLQAADLWAGLNRAACDGDENARNFLRTIKTKNHAFLWDMGNLAELLGRSLKRTPDLTSGNFYEDRKSRSKRLATDRKLLRDGEN